MQISHRVTHEARKNSAQIDISTMLGWDLLPRYHVLSEDSVIKVNLEAPIQLSRMVIPDMLERGSGRIVNMSSLGRKVRTRVAGILCSTKSGLTHLPCHCGRLILLPCKRSAICPGFVEARYMHASRKICLLCSGSIRHVRSRQRRESRYSRHSNDMLDY